MRKTFYTLLLFYLIPAFTLSQDTIRLSKGMVNVSSQGALKIYYDQWHKENFASVSKKLEDFEDYDKHKVPHKYTRGQYTNWLKINVENPYPDTFFLALEGYLMDDSLWVFHNEKLIEQKIGVYHPLRHDTFQIINKPLLHVCVLTLPTSGRYTIWIKNYDSHYGIGKNVPKIYDAYFYEGNYYKRNYLAIFFFEGSVLALFTLIVIFGFRAYLTKDKAIILYVLFAIACLIVNFRNLESINTYIYSTANFWTWEQTKVFHSLAVFFTYIKFIENFINRQNIKNEFRSMYIFMVCMMTIEVILMCIGEYTLYYRYINYQVLRTVLTLFGFFCLKEVYLSDTKYAKYIFTGIMAMIIAEMVSWFYGGTEGSIISLLGIYTEFIIFSLVLSFRSYDYMRATSELTIKNNSLEIEKVNVERDVESRISRDLHDDVGTGLVSLRFLLQSLIEEEKIDAKKVRGVLDQINDIQDNIRHNIFALKSENRILREFIYEIKRFFNHYCELHQIETSFDIGLSDEVFDKEIKGSTMRNIYLILRELCNNSFKHGDATSIHFDISYDGYSLIIKHVDNGKSNDTNLVLNSGNGLLNINKRIEEENGSITYTKSNGWCTYLKIPFP